MSVLGKIRAEDIAAAELAAGVASYALGVPQEAIVEGARGPVEVAFARQVAMYLCLVGFELSLPRVAAAFGRDRSTVAHACHAIEDRRDDGQFDLWIGGLEVMLQKAPSPRLGVSLAPR
ncbi:MAG: helix-turn-helix domain-containing protein [Hyphomonadaceae bacterium]